MRAMNRLTVRILVAAALVAAAGCAQNSARVQKAKTTYYQTDYTVVWNAVLEAVRAEGYDRIKVADAATGVIVTDWHKVERVADSQAVAGNKIGGMASGVDSSGANFFQARIKIEGKKPPFRIVVDGEAARYRPNFSSLIPYKRHAEDEPQWVDGRIDAIYVQVLDRLEQYAVAPTEVQRGAVEEPPAVGGSAGTPGPAPERPATETPPDAVPHTPPNVDQPVPAPNPPPTPQR
jgi:hypothetical protein